MSHDVIMILLIFFIILAVPVAAVFIVLGVNKYSRKKKKQKYTLLVKAQVADIIRKGSDFPDVVCAVYSVNGKQYTVKETLKLKSEAIKIAGVPIGTKKIYVLGSIKKGDTVTVRCDERDPSKAIIDGNDGFVNV